jgi:hypothetical protein
MEEEEVPRKRAKRAIPTSVANDSANTNFIKPYCLLFCPNPNLDIFV